MKSTIFKLSFLYMLTFFMLSCGSSSNSEAFIESTTGRYLFNSDEIIEVYFEEQDLYLKWRGATAIKPLKTSENEFFVKEMNEKIQFNIDTSDGTYITLLPKKSEEGNSDPIKYIKLDKGERVPKEYLEAREFDLALEAYKKLFRRDTLDGAIQENQINRLGYNYLRNDDIETAVFLFSMNTEFYPESSNVYDSLGEALLEQGDSINAVLNYKKSLELDPGNNRARNIIKKIEKK